MRTALYGGTFDPIHHGHLILAREAMEQLALDRVIFIPAALSPFKEHTQPASSEARLSMLLAAIADEPRYECDQSELHREGPSYTVDTVNAWRAQAPEDQLFYLIGQDHIPDLTKWHRWDVLQKMVTFVVFERDEPPTHGFPAIRKRLDISSTDIRKRVAEHASIRYLVPDSVRQIILARQLYQKKSY